MIIAVDFDGTLVEHKYPEIGKTIHHVLNFVRDGKRNGNKIILHTCRHGKELEEAIKWMKDRDIEPDAVNDDVPSVKNSDFGRSKSNKPFANIYLDDRAVSLEMLKAMTIKES